MHGTDFKLFLGRVHCSHAVTTFLDTHEIDAFSLLHRWQRGDWGEVEINNSAQNKLFGKNSKAIAAQAPQGRVVGVYPIGPAPIAGDLDSRDRLWISGCPFAGKGANTTILMMSEFQDMEANIADIPPLRQLGLLPGLPDWKIACRTWTTSKGKQYQFVVSHPNDWFYEYRCTDKQMWLGNYWCTYPQSQVLQAVVESTILLLIYEEWDWMTHPGISP